MTIAEGYIKHPEASVIQTTPVDQHRKTWPGVRDRLNDLERSRMIGPHEYREIELMKAGIKPAAMFDESQLPYWKDAIEENGWTVRKVATSNPQLDQYAVCLPGHEARLNQIDKIYKRIRVRKTWPRMTREDHMKLGRILGYTKQQISSFLKQPSIATNIGKRAA